MREINLTDYTKTNIIFNNDPGKKEISIFKTSVIEKREITLLRNLLDTLVGHHNWNFDLEDEDKILRIKSHRSINNFLAQEINKVGYLCYELF